MFPTVSYVNLNTFHLSPDDIRGIQFLYGKLNLFTILPYKHIHSYEWIVLRYLHLDKTLISIFAFEPYANSMR